MLVYIVMLVEYALFGGCASTYAPFSGGRLLVACQRSARVFKLFFCFRVVISWLVARGVLSLLYCMYTYVRVNKNSCTYVCRSKRHI